jgi:hypothetical protein
LEEESVNTSWFLAHLLLGGVALGPAFLLIGALRALRVWGWRLEQAEVALSRRLGLAPGTRAPAFLELARERGFLQPEGVTAPIPCGANGFDDERTHPQQTRGAPEPSSPRRALSTTASTSTSS